MKIISLVLVSVLATFMLGLSGSIKASAATTVNLGTADNFAVLAGTTITNTGPSVVTGDLGLAPGTSVTGFPPGTVSGTQHVTDAVASQAQIDLVTAYDSAASQTPIVTVSADLGGSTLAPGIYNSASSLGLTGTLTLDGQSDPNSVFIFQAGSTLTTASGSMVSLINGAQACNVFWQIGSSATLGTNSNLTGSVLALTSITATSGVSINGRLLARNGAVTLDKNTITKTACEAPKPVEEKLGGLNVNGYCKSLGQTEAKLTDTTWTCLPSGNQIDMNKACQWQYKIENAIARKIYPNKPLTWQCYKTIVPPPIDNQLAPFNAQYFDNQNLTGTPKLSRIDQKINFATNNGPFDSSLPSDHFSVRWTKTQFMKAGKYSFTLKSDDGIRFWVDDTLIVDDWTDHSMKTYTPDILVKGGNHTFKVEYFENTGGAVAILNEDFPARDRTSPAPIIIP
jgi:hypothetical protein